MFPPSSGFNLDIDAISGILGSVSIACWVVVFSPQIIENFRRSSAEGLSVEFIIIWLVGDVFNILGAILQGVLPTMIILAIYYTFADIVLLGQCFYYRGFMLRDPRPDKPSNAEEESAPTERSALLANGNGTNGTLESSGARTRSQSSFRERLASLDGTLFSPATPMHPPTKDYDLASATASSPARTWTQAILFNSTAIVLVILAGIFGYYLSPAPAPRAEPGDQTRADEQMQSLTFSLWGQIFGYVCAVFYLGSRVPQLLLNYRRKSTEGLNALFFLFACIGNLTYVLSIFAFEPVCTRHKHGHWHESTCRPGQASAIYGRYILVNLSWLIGSLGTLFLDFAVFIQFFLYRNNAKSTNPALRDTPHDEDRGRPTNDR